MRRFFTLSILLCLASYTALAQDSSSTSQPPPPPPMRSLVAPQDDVPPFSRMSFGAGVSPLGIGFQVSTDLDSHLNVRGIGNVFSYSTTLTSSGIPFSAALNLDSGGAMLDYYPFHHGFRLSGGALFVNRNGATATASIPGGTSITINNQTYYSANTNPATGATPLAGAGSLTLNTTTPSAVLTTGWGNPVKRSGHWDFPVEIGVAFIGTPKVNLALSGWACTDQTQLFCANIASPTNPIAQQFQANLSTQIAKWNSNISGLDTYPIVSFGVAYSFRVRSYQVRKRRLAG